MGMDLNAVSLAASGIKAGIGLAQGITGMSAQKKLWRSRPVLGVTEGEKANDSLYRQLASATEIPGQARAEGKLSEAYSSGVYDAQRTANSSLGATQSAVDLASKKMNAVKDLAGQFADYKAQRMDALAGWNKEKIGLDQQRFDINQLQPWNTKMNEAIAQKQAGFGSAGSAVDSGLGMLNDMAGTKKLEEMFKSLYGNGAASGAVGSSLGNFGNILGSIGGGARG